MAWSKKQFEVSKNYTTVFCFAEELVEEPDNHGYEIMGAQSKNDGEWILPYMEFKEILR